MSSYWPANPRIYQINTFVWLHELSKVANFAIDLRNIPEETIGDICNDFDAVWLMGVWERSPNSQRVSRTHPGLITEYHKALNDYTEEDVIGSPYAVYNYFFSPLIGGIEGIRDFRNKLTRKNVKLILDFVPNHVAVDHIWTVDNPDIFLKGDRSDLLTYPEAYFEAKGNILAHGKDPNFPAWTDTVQINAFSPAAREKLVNTLLNIAKLSDGVRCDMAMLMTNEVFRRTWGSRGGDSLKKEFWVEIISKVKKKHPNFLFMAEVYWDMEWTLQQQGFDFCYDKRLYDRLKSAPPNDINAHLKADMNYQRKLLRFIENHDEERAANVFPKQKLFCASLIELSLLGGCLIHEGQLKGYKIRIPIQLQRRAFERINPEICNYFKKLFGIIRKNMFEQFSWELCEVTILDDAKTIHPSFIAYRWFTDTISYLFVINYDSNTNSGHVRINEEFDRKETWEFRDLLTDISYNHKAEHLKEYGLFVELKPWNSHVLLLKRT